ncbi:MAG: type II toxin-antitoxin system RelE/ParE family toxin [Terracidiphilus sp.]
MDRTRRTSLEEIANYIRKDNPSAARAVAETLFEAANGLEILPYRGRIGRIEGTRELIIPRLPYIVVYQVMSQAVHILHIYHGARNWPGGET